MFGERLSVVITPRPLLRVATACRAGSCFGHKFNLGLMYSNGEGVPKSDAEVVGSYRKAADLPAFLWLSFHS